MFRGSAMDTMVRGAEGQESPHDTCTCNICNSAISASEMQIMVARKINKDYCVKDNYALRGFNACCKSQGTEQQMRELQKSNPELWKETVQQFRDPQPKSSIGLVVFLAFPERSERHPCYSYLTLVIS